MDVISQWAVLLLVTPFVLGFVGQQVKRSILGPRATWPKDGFRGARGFYWSTMGWHPVIAGLLLGLGGFYVGFPVPSAFGRELGGALLAGACSGGVSVIAYALIVRTLRRLIVVFGSMFGGQARDAVASIDRTLGESEDEAGEDEKP